MKRILLIAVLSLSVIFPVAASAQCSVPTGEFGGSLEIANMPGVRIGTTVKIVSAAPPVVEFALHGVRGCTAGASFKSIAEKSTCEGSLMKLVIDRSSASLNDCRTPIEFHLRAENGKLVGGRYGGPAIQNGTDNIRF